MVTSCQHRLSGRRVWILLLLPLVFWCFSSSKGVGQEYLAAISGTVADSTGAVLPNVQVVAENADTHFKTVATTNKTGAYAIPFLTPGTYTVTVTAKGFRPAAKSNIVLHASDKVIADMSLAVGAESESVQVTADMSTLDTGTASQGQVLDSEEVVNLPNIGRNPFVEATLANGTYTGNFVTGSASQYNQPYSGTASQLQVNGIADEHLLELNGIPDDAPERLSAVKYMDFVPSPEAVQEVNTQTLLIDAQNGHADGAVINTILKTGQNQLHGALYYILQNTDMNANSTQRKQASTTKGAPSVDRWQQPGFVLDGPIDIPKIYNGHNKSFFMVAYEHITTNTPNPYEGFMPTDAMRGGDFSGLCNTFNSVGLCTSGTQIYSPASTVDAKGNRISYFPYNNLAGSLDPVAVAMAKFFPEPNLTSGNSSYNYISSDDTIKDHYWSLVSRLDHKLTPSQTLTGLFFKSERHQLYPVQGFPIGGGIGSPGYTHSRNDMGASLEWLDTLSSSMVLDSRLGFMFHPFTLTYYGDNYDITKLGLPASLAAELPRETFPGASFSGGNNKYSSFQSGGGQYSQSEIVTWTEVLTKSIGRHSVKGGIEFDGLRYDVNTPTSSLGTFSFNKGFTQKNYLTGDSTSGDPMAAFMLGAVGGGSVSWQIEPAYQQDYWGIFLQDDWHFNNRMTFNLGVRWDYEAPITERFNRMNAGFCSTCTNPLQASVSGLTLNGGLLFTSDKNRLPYHKELNNWQPRFGVAYLVTPKVVLRGGLGLIYLPTFSPPGTTGYSASTSYSSTVNGYNQASSLSDPYPSGLVQPSGSSLGLATSVGQNISAEERNFRQPRLFFGAIGMEYQLPKSAVVEVAYVGNAARHMLVSKNINALPSSEFALGSTALQTMVSNPMAGLIPNNSTLNGANIQMQYLLVPYPEFGSVTIQNRPLGYTSYNALQMSVRKRFSDGFSFQGHYTLSKQMGATGYVNSQDNWDNLFRSEANAPNRLWNVIGSYNIPVPFRNNYWSRVWLGGWSIHGVVRSNNGSLMGWPSASGDYVDRIAGVSLRGGGNNRDMNHQFNTCYIDPAGTVHPGGWNKTVAATTGACGYGDPAPAWKLRTSSFSLASYAAITSNIRQMVLPIADVSLFKKFQVHKRFNVELRGEFFNVANTPNYGSPNTNLFATGANGGAGSVTWTQGNDPRMGQVTARINF